MRTSIYTFVLLILLLGATTANANDSVAIWSNSSTEPLDWSGSENSVEGVVHSNAGIKLGGSDNLIEGATRSVRRLDNGGGNNVFSPAPQRVDSAAWPFRFDMLDYRPGGRAAQSAGSQFFDESSVCDADDKWERDVQGRQLQAGLYWVPCDVVFNASDLSGEITIISTGKIEVSGSDDSLLKSFIDGVLFWTSYAEEDAIKLSGSKSVFDGFMMAPQGRIELSGSELALSCGILGDTIKLNGSKTEITGDGCTTPFAQDGLYTTPEDTPIGVVLEAFDLDNDSLSYVLVGEPQFGDLTGAGKNYTYTPGPNFNGNDSFQFKVTDGIRESNIATVKIIVTPVNDKPLADNQDLETPEDTSLSIVLTGNDVDSDTLNFEFASSVENGTISGDAPNLVYTPNANFHGAEQFTFKVNDGEIDSDFATVSIRVIPVNDPPVADDQSLTTQGGLPLEITLTGSDIDADDLNYQLVSEPTNGSLSGSLPNLVYVPNSGFEGVDSFTFKVDDGEADSNIATISITVIEPNLPPKITTEPPLSVFEENQYQYDVDAIDPNNDVLSYSLSNSHPTMSIDSESGLINWAPDKAFTQSVPDFNSQCYVVPENLVAEGDDSFIAELYVRVRESLKRGSEYSAPQTIAWNNRNRCLGCHVQNQTLLGLQASLSKAEVDEEAAEFLLADILSSQLSDGAIRRSHPQYANTQTGFAVWALSYVPDRDRTFDARARALNFFANRVTRSGENRSFASDHPSGWLRTREAMTAIVALSASRYLMDASEKSDLTAAQLAAQLFYFNEMPGIIRYLLSIDSQRSETLLIALKQVGLAEGVKFLADGQLKDQAEQMIADTDAVLRSRQLLDGGWRRFNNGGASDPLTSAWVGFALNYLNPSINDPVVQKNIVFLLDTQRSDGTWVTNSGLFSTRLATTGLVMAYLPIALEFLGNPDVTVKQIYLDEDNQSLSADLTNRGLGDINTPVTAVFYAGEPSNGNVLGSIELPEILSGAELSPQISLTSPLEDNVFVVLQVDENANECVVTNNQSSAVLASVEVRDGRGGSDTQSWLLNVLDVNEAPQIISQPNTQLLQGLPYDSTVLVSDADVGDAQAFALVEAPAGLLIDTLTGEFAYNNDVLAAGVHTVTVRVTDLRGLTAEQTFNLEVLANTLPQITSVPDQDTVVVRSEFNYDVEAVDADLDVLIYSLRQSPLSMQIDNATGEITWEPGNLDIGELSIEVLVSDARGGEATQSFTLTVNENLPPVIESTPTTTQIALGSTFVYPVIATDPEAQPLTFALLQAPAGMSIELNGEVSFTPSENQLGSHLVEVAVSDSVGSQVSQTFTLIVQQATVNNAAPLIVSQPSGGAFVGQAYRYNVVATDSDGDSLTYLLVIAPQGMAINAASGQVVWTPLDSQLGEQSIVVRVEDGRGGYSTQTYAVFVNLDSASNEIPVISSQPSFTAKLGEEYFYQLRASDADGDSLNYTLSDAPAGASISGTGLVSWTPQEVGLVPIRARVSDGKSFIEQTWQIRVADDSEPPVNNEAPVIVSQPEGSAVVGELYTYDVNATDADSDVITYLLLTAPSGMSIDANTGEISWQPIAEQQGSQEIAIRAVDGKGGSSTQSYAIFVNDAASNNATPVISSQPELNTRLGVAYSYQTVAFDADGDSLSYSLIESPTGLAIDANGFITWNALEAGLYNIRVRVSDQLSFAEQSWQLKVLSADVVLAGQISITPKVVNQGETVTIQVQPVNAIGDVSITMTVDGIDQPLDQNNQAQVIGDVIGSKAVVATITDRFDTVEITDSFSVRDPNDVDAPTASFGSLVDGQVITAPVDIVASIEDPNLSIWQLVSLPKNAKPTEFIVLASGTANVTNETIAVLDPSLLRNGQYAIALIASDSNGQTTQESVTVKIDRDLKVGNFSITFEDLNIPLGGIPISVRRTYDSRDRAQNLDFGFGWSLDYQNIKVEESRTPGRGWSQNEYPFGPLGVLTRYCVEPQGAPVVTVTLPDGNVESFEVGASPRCNDVVPNRTVDMSFTATGDTQTTLEAVGAGGFYLNGNDLLEDIASSDLADPNAYRLTTRAGFIYDLDQEFGISKVTDPNGNTLTYSDDGIVHSDGKRVDFVRDAAGRVTKVTDPMGGSLNYNYDTRGDLEIVTERDLAETTFTYNQNHGLLDIIDPLGRNVVRNIYDDNGRLIAQEDSEGMRTEFTHDLSGRESVVTDRNGNTSFVYYDENGYVTSQVDALGNTTSYTHDVNGNELSQTNALGHMTVATYSDKNDQLTQTDALGNITRFEYDQRGKETKIIDARGNAFDNTYDSVGNLLSVTDPLDNVAGNNINRHGLPSKTIDVLGNETNYTYDDEGNKLTETDSEGNIMSFTYDNNNNVLSDTRTRLVNGVATQEATSYEYDTRDRVINTTDALGNVTIIEYDLVGNEIAQVDALGRRTTMSYDAYNRLLSTTYPDGTSSSNVYDSEGNLLSSTDRLGRVTTNEHDALNRVIKVTQADGSVTTTEYDAIGRVVAEVDANLNRTQYEYDAANRRISSTDALNHVTLFAYDADGNMVQMTDANGNVTSYNYNELDQKVQTTFQNASTMLEGLDALSRKTSMTDQAGVTTNYAYDKLGRLTKVTDALLQETTYSYDSVGNKLTQTDAEGRTTSWSYDALGRVISRTLPLGQTESMSYDEIGNVTQSTDFKGQITTYAYDVNNRMTQVVYEGGLTEEYVYDAVGNRTQAMKTENGVTSTWNYTYDNLNRLVSETQFTGTADEVTLSYDYDAQGNRITLTETTATSARITRYTFDTLNRLKTVQDPEGNTTTYSYDAVGNRLGISHQNGIQTGYVYDELNRLTSLNHKDSTNVTLKQFDYTLLPNGKRSKIVEANGRTTDYTYDTLYRLTTEGIFDPVNASHNASYTYDKVGNRTFEVVNGVSTAYTVDANDRLVQTGGTIYTHDANGNTLTETLDGDVTTYSYNAKNEVTGSVKAGTTTAYLYNVDRIRIGKGDAGSQTLYTVDSNRSYAQVLTEKTDGVTAVGYTYGDDLVSQVRGTDISTYHYDGLGSTRALSNATGSITDTYDYEAFGEVLSQTGSTENDYLFTGEQFDSSLDQYYLRARYYDQGVGRFTQMDTWMGINSDPVTLHKYLYANADPANMVDPTGNFSIGSVSVGGSISGILSTLSVASTAFDIFSASTDGDGLTAKEAGFIFLASFGGPAGGKLMKMFNRKGGGLARKFGCNSFAESTLITTKNGLVEIQDIQIDDLVLTYNEETGEHEYKPVIHLIHSEELSETLVIKLSSGDVINATEGHLIFVDGKWTAARDLKIGDYLRGVDGDVKIIEIEKSISKVKVYNFTVEGNPNYFVGENGILVHNISPCEKAAKELVKLVPKRCIGVKNKCDDYALNLEKLLLDNKVKGKRLCLKSKRTSFIGSIKHGNISGNSEHFAVQVGDLVFDNIEPEGVPFAQWADDLGLNEDLGLDLKSEEMTGRRSRNGCIR